ncbi:MAG: hypothetical protein RLZZ204_923, partial [Bacteroidota bacterium]
MKNIFLGASLLLCLNGLAQKKQLSEQQMLRNEKTTIVTPLPQVLGWVNDESFLINKKEHPDSAFKPFLVDCKTGKSTPSSTSLLSKKEAEVYSVSIREGEIYLSFPGRSSRKLTSTRETEINPTLSPDQEWVAFTRKNDLYTIHVASGKEYRLTNDGTDLILNGYASWVYFEEILGRPTRYKSFWWSPNSKQLVFMRMDDTKVPLFPIYSEAGQHGYSENTRYPKAGDANPTVKIGFTSPEGGSVTWADFNEQNDQYFGMPYWTPDGNTALVQWMNRGQDQLIIYSVDPTTGVKKELYKEEQKTWIDLDDQGGRISFLPNKKGFILQSDKDGWEQLYWHNMDGSLKNKITSGNYWST